MNTTTSLHPVQTLETQLVRILIERDPAYGVLSLRLGPLDSSRAPGLLNASGLRTSFDLTPADALRLAELLRTHATTLHRAPRAPICGGMIHITEETQP